MSEPAQDPADLKRRFTSRQFWITLISIGLVFAATMYGKELGPLAAVVSIAIGGAAGVNLVKKQ